MDNNKKIEALNMALNKYGLSLDMPEVNEFFFAKRYYQPIMSEYEDFKTCKNYNYSPYIRPVKKRLVPTDFENASYGQFDSLMDWYLYENSESNPLVWNNIGNQTFDIKSSFENRRKSDSVQQDIRGNIFNVNDGNHRLLTLIINQFLESKTATSDQELKNVYKKYEMEIDVSLPFSAELCDLLREVAKEYMPYDENQVTPIEARSFRDSSFEYGKNSSCCVDYNPKTGMLTFNLNNEKFCGNEQELIKYLKQRKPQPEPIMMWEADGLSYISCKNNIYKSKDKNKIISLLPKIKQAYKANKFEDNKFLTIKDVDSNSYDMQLSGFYIENKSVAKKYAENINDILNSDYKDVFLNKLQIKNFLPKQLMKI